jgi:tRNA (mo5U34)-methyltransferase
VRQKAGEEVLWPSEREVAAEVPIEVDPAEAQRVLRSVPLWFHTFALNREHDLYSPGVARDHGYRLASIPECFDGASVLDVGAFDGFYSFLAEARGAARVVAVDNEQYVDWVRDRWDVELSGGEGFRAIKDLIGARVEYRRLDAFELDALEERFDFIFCFGLLHRVENPLGLLRLLSDRLNEGGRMLIETYGIDTDDGNSNGNLHVPAPGEVYPDDRFVFWQFSSGALANLVKFTELSSFELHRTPLIDGHPRIIGVVTKAASAAAG